MIIDTHTHLYSKEFAEDIDEVMKRAEQENVQKFFLPAIDSETHEDMVRLEARYPGKCFSMMGLHPCSVKENYKEELRTAEDWFARRKFAAVGEIGLDYYWDRTFEKQQLEAFETQIDWAFQYELPIVIHTRNAMQETIEVVKARQNGSLRGIFHCFSGSYESAKEIVKAGFYLGIGGVLTYKNAHLPEALKDIDLQHVVLETDAPYLTPVPFRGKRNESCYLKYVVEKLAEVKQVSVEEVCRITTENAQKIFGL